MEVQEQRFGKEQSYAVERLINPRGAAEGSTVPPPQRGRGRVPRIKNLTLARTQTWLGGTQFSLIWDEPEEFRKSISHFNIYIINLLDANKAPLGPWTAAKSPAEIYVSIRQQTPCTLIVQTVLKSGLISDLADSPAVSGYLGAPGITSSDVSTEVATVTGASYSITNATIILADATSNSITLTLPVVTGDYANRLYWIKRIDNVGGNSITVATPGTETIDGAASLNIVGQNICYGLTNDGANWFIISAYTVWG